MKLTKEENAALRRRLHVVEAALAEEDVAFGLPPGFLDKDAPVSARKWCASASVAYSVAVGLVVLLLTRAGWQGRAGSIPGGRGVNFVRRVPLVSH